MLKKLLIFALLFSFLGCTVDELKSDALSEELSSCKKENAFFSENCQFTDFNFLKFDESICDNKELLMSFCKSSMDEESDLPDFYLQKCSDEKFLQFYKARCLDTYALINNDPVLCDKEGIISYTSNCFLSLAVLNKDYFYCDYLDYLDERFKSACLGEVAIAKRDFDTCKKISGYGKTLCMNFFSKFLNDASACKEMNAGWEKDICLINFALATKDKSLCEYIDETSKKVECEIRLEIISNKEVICEKFLDDLMESKSICYFFSANHFKDNLLCDKIKEDKYIYYSRERCLSFVFVELSLNSEAEECIDVGMYEKTNCVMNLAKKIKDVSKCNSILEKWKQEYCKQEAVKSIGG